MPAGAGKDFGLHPVGTGPFQFVSQAQDDAVVLERSPQLTADSSQLQNKQTEDPPFAERAKGGPPARDGQAKDAKDRPRNKQGSRSRAALGMTNDPVEQQETSESTVVERVRFRVVPDAIVRALELRKGSADVEMSSLSPDIIPVLAKRKELEVTERPGTNFAYLKISA